MAVYLVARGPKYTRDGIDNIGDIFEIFEGDNPPGGPGYALSDIVEIVDLTKVEVDEILNARKPEIVIDEKEEKEYWYDADDTGNWYEIIIKPKYELNLSDLSVQDRSLLSSTQSTSAEQINAIAKIKPTLTLYDINKTILQPEK